jgi:ribulose-5-phosphate 4-epimerase/fuculose-1-phosphate aldolase
MRNCEGYIKFNYDLEPGSNITGEDIKELNEARQNLYANKLIGVYDNGIGYGNVSRRYGSGFIITGSETGKKDNLELQDYCLIDSYNINFNYVRALGSIPPSSESLTHAAVYSASNNINSVLHIHDEELWMRALNVMPSSNPDFSFGTRELAHDIQRMLMERSIVERGIIIMSGHPEGILLFGENVNHALRNMEKLYAL